MALSLPYLPSTVAHTTGSVTKPKTIDSTWVYAYKAKPWPVVLCDPKSLPTAFLQSRPQGHVYPAILLGKHIYIWVLDSLLRDYDPGAAYLADCPAFDNNINISETDTEDDKLEKQRQHSFRIDAPQAKVAAFWVDFMRSKSEARRIDREMARQNEARARQKRENRKERKRQLRDPTDEGHVDILSSSTLPLAKPVKANRSRSGRRASRGDQSPTPNPTPIKQQRLSKEASPNNRDGDYETENMSAKFLRSKRSSSDQSVDDGYKEEMKRARKKQRQASPEVSYNPKSCLIEVGSGDNPTTFGVRYQAVGKSNLLVDSVKLKTPGTTVFLTDDKHIAPQAFIPVVEYLQHNEFEPRLTENNGIQVLAGVALQDEKHSPALRIAYAYMIAARLALNDLQTLCFQKLSAIFPLDPLTLVMVLRIYAEAPKWDAEAEDAMRDWLMDHIAEYYWTLVETEGGAFSRLMQEDDEMSRGVHMKLANWEYDGMGGM